MRIGQEAKDFMHACEAIHVLLDQGPLTPDEHRAIELTGMALMSKVMPTS